MADNRGLTGRGKAWEMLNSWWILLSFFVLSWIGFFYIGIKAKQKKWYLAGAVFFLLQFVLLLAAPNVKSTAYDIAMVIFFSAYIVGIILSFRARKEYLICRDIMLNARFEEQKTQRLRETVMRNYRDQGIENMQATKEDSFTEVVRAAMREGESPKPEEQPKPQAETREQISKETQEEVPRLDINACSELALSELPGVSVAAAKKAVAYRTEHHGFSDVDDFYAAVGMKPHFIVRLEDRLTCGPYVPPESVGQKTGTGRKLDF